MPKTRAKKRLLTCSLAAALWAASPGAVAHTSVKAQATEGVSSDNAMDIGHGCDEKPLIAQSVVFPAGDPQISASDSAVVISDLSEVIDQGGLEGLVDTIQSRDIFRVQGEKHDANGNAIGFYGRKGRLRPDLEGRVPFEFTGPSFSSSSCATRLLVKLAVADICDTHKPTIVPEKVNLWIPDNGSHFAILGLAAGVEGIGEEPTLIVNRDLDANPLDPSCNGVGYDVIVTPSAAQIDRDLPIPNYWRAR